MVERYSKTGELDALDTWGVSSGVLKIGNVVIVEARVSKSYMVGQDHRDEFVVFRVSQAMNSQSRTDLSKQRSEFLTALVTDTWQEVNYGGYTDHKFRPVEGQLKGRNIHLNNNKIGGVPHMGVFASHGGVEDRILRVYRRYGGWRHSCTIREGRETKRSSNGNQKELECFLGIRC